MAFPIPFLPAFHLGLFVCRHEQEEFKAVGSRIIQEMWITDFACVFEGKGARLVFCSFPRSIPSRRLYFTIRTAGVRYAA